jgi:hypothetical protein
MSAKSIVLALAASLLVVTANAAAQQPPSPGGSANRPPTAAPLVADPTLGMALLFATVKADGTIDRGAGVTSVENLGDGSYAVVFNRDVSGCGYFINVADSSVGTVLGLATAVRRVSRTDAVFVQTASSNGTAFDQPFQLLVFCAH